MNTPESPIVPTSRKPKRPRPLTSKQIYPRVIKPLSRLRSAVAKVAEGDQAFVEIQKQLDAMASVLWKLHDRRELQEAQAQDRGEVSWTIFHPRGRFIFDLQRVAIRTPRTIKIIGEYCSIPDSPARLASKSVEAEFEKEMERTPFDLAKFREHAAFVDASYRKYLQRGGPEEEAA